MIIYIHTYTHTHTHTHTYIYLCFKSKDLERSSPKMFTVKFLNSGIASDFFSMYIFLNFLEYTHTVSCVNCNKSPQMEWITTEMYCLTVLEARILKLASLRQN